MSAELVNEKLTLINNELREIRNENSKYGLDQMQEQLGSTNDELTEQEELILELQNALGGKISGSSYTEEANDTGTTAIIW